MTDTSPESELCFEDALASLEQIVHDLEEGRIGLAESLARYEEGVKLLRKCHSLLEHAERRIELLTGVDAAGNPVTEPFDDEATHTGDETSAPRSRRGGRKAKKGDASESVPRRASPPPIDEPGGLF